MGKLVGTIAKTIITIAAAETLWVGFGMNLPTPSLLALGMFASAGILTAFWFQKHSSDPQVRHAFEARTGRTYSPFIGSIGVWVVAGVVVAIAYLIFSNPLERYFWNTGNFGEPTGNRFVSVTEVDPRLGGNYAYMVEWGVRYSLTDGVLATIEFDGPVTEYTRWLEPGGASTARVNQDELQGATKLGQYNAIEGECCAGARFEKWDVTPRTHFYVYVESNEPRRVVDCYFGDAAKIPDDEYDCRGDFVELLAIGASK